MSLRIQTLKTEYAECPIGLDVPNPRLGWTLVSSRRGKKQSAYHIIVSSNRERLDRLEGDLWDSGIVQSDASQHVEYAGKPLRSGQTCYWKVRVWDEQGAPSEWSDAAYWVMGLLSPREEWVAEWLDKPRDLSHEPELLRPAYLRRTFRLRSGIRRAFVYATALGDYALFINGRRINDHFAPGWTDYAKRLQYQTIDVTDLLNDGDNAFGIILGAGWYAGTVGMSGTRWYGNRPAASMQLVVDYADGTRETVCTDAGWKASDGPLLYSDHIMGECYDATREFPGWTEPGFDDSGWSAPDIQPRYTGELVAQVDPPVKIMMTLKPRSVTRTDRGTFIFDMGQNMVGWTELRVRGPAGTKVTLSHAEMLKPDGTLYIENLRDAVQQDHYILRGDPDGERYEPHFTYHGFRYVELIGYPGEADLDTITGKVVHSATPRTGWFECSHDMINRLYSNILWGQRGNFLSVPTDCPQRDERLGWTGDAQIFIRTASYNMDVARFFTKYMDDVTDAQLDTGAFPDVAPDGGWIWFKTTKKPERWLAPDNAGWGDAGIIIPWTMYLVYGDKRILERKYPAMVRFMDYLHAGAVEYIRPDYGDYGDWLSINSVTPNEVVATAYFAYDAHLMSRIADVLGCAEDAARYRELFLNIRDAFNRTFVDGEGRIKGNSQTVYILALRFNLLTGERKEQAVRHLTEDIIAHDNHLTTGFLGVGHLLPVLSDHGHDELAYTLLKQETFPSWLYPITQGATTIWERWDSWTEHKGFGPARTNSMNHYALGSVGEWLYRYMAGIDTSDKQPGYKHLRIAPRIGGGMDHVRAEYETLYGLVCSGWQIEDGRCTVDVTIPVNATAEIVLPAPDREHITVAAGAEAIRQIAADGGRTVIHVGSGDYRFVFPCPVNA